ncbi:EAL domain-containing protein [Rhodophyticola sp. MJ-SS7]|nr:EAL domain-containing protein [Rhodophyticola sp. MJ-SS7]
MLLRTIVFLTAMALLAWGGFRALVENEVKRVVSVHVLDKTSHLVDMLEADGAQTADLVRGVIHPESFRDFGVMAHAIQVASVFFYSTDGVLITQLDTTVMGRMSASGGGAEPGGMPNRGAMPDRGTSGANPASGDYDGGHGHSGGHELDLPLSYPEIADLTLPNTRALRALFDGATSQYLSIHVIERTDGTPRSFAVPVMPVLGADGARVGFVGFVVDATHIYSTYARGVSAFAMLFLSCGVVLFGVPALGFWLQKRLAERSSRDATYLSRHDALTGLLNRSAFVAEAQKWLDDGRIGFAAYVDVDRFKLINDTYGHSVGDAFLRHIAGILREICGAAALVARLGGDEFTLVLPVKDREATEAVVARLMRRVSEGVEIDGLTVSSSISIGVAEPRRGDTLDALLQRADIALYHAKSAGRDTASFFTEEMGAAARRRRFLETRLRDACRTQKFELAFQPLVDAETSEILGYEALLRLDDAEGTPIPPSEFVPLAEEIGLIETIGTWVLFAATREIQAYDDQVRVSVNLSAEQFRSGDLVNLVSDALEQSGLSPERLELEITESVLLDENSSIAFQIDALKDMGIRFAMDDFGTGYSSLSTLWRYGFDRIKIDRSFVQALEESTERSQQMIELIVLLGTRMGMSITAEGIETEHQRKMLATMGCNVLQGYLFGRPAPLQAPRGPAAEASAS